MSFFETETVAELCIKQGLMAEGLEIYRRLLASAPDEVTRARRQRRLAELERGAGVPARAADHDSAGPPALRIQRRGEELIVEWNLPGDPRPPAVQLLMVRRTANGIETESRTVRLEGTRGRTAIAAPPLHSLRAAAGWMEGGRFIPIVRLAEQSL